MVKKKSSYLNRKKKDEINKKAMIWVGAIIVTVIAALALLIVFNN